MTRAGGAREVGSGTWLRCWERGTTMNASAVCAAPESRTVVAGVLGARGYERLAADDGIGGIAHDINNLLSIILGYSEMVATDLQPSDPILQDMLEISGAARRAAQLAMRLVALSRQQTLEPQHPIGAKA
jgi:signal transduction histidine kinase